MNDPIIVGSGGGSSGGSGGGSSGGVPHIRIFNTSGQNQPMGDYSPETSAELARQERRRQIATMLMQQGLEGGPAYQKAGRFIVPRGWASGVGDFTKVLTGAIGHYQSDTASREAIDKETTERKLVIETLRKQLAPTPASKETTEVNTNEDYNRYIPAQPERPASIEKVQQALLDAAANTRDPKLLDFINRHQQTLDRRIQLEDTQAERSRRDKNEADLKRELLASQLLDKAETRKENARNFLERLKLQFPHGRLTPGEEVVDRKFAEDYVQFKANGGYADVEKSLGQLGIVAADLQTEELTGPLTGSTPDWLLKFTNPASIDAREKVEEIAQRNLRLVLGAQFTEKEGVALIKRTYNVNLDEPTNRARVVRLMKQITDAAKAKEDASSYFEEHGTLKGWKGKLWSLSDFDPDKKQVTDAAPKEEPNLLDSDKKQPAAIPAIGKKPITIIKWSDLPK